MVGCPLLEFHDRLHALGGGELAPSPRLTGVVGLDGVENVIDILEDADRHAKILIDPKSTGRGDRVGLMLAPPRA